MTERTGWPVPTIATVAILGAGFALTVAVNWPGHLSYDSIEQLLEGRTGLYNTWHPPVMAWLLGQFDAVLPGTALFVVFDAALAFGALLALTATGRARWWSAAVALAIMFLPQFLLYQGIVWKDVLFADAAVAGFVCLARAAGNRPAKAVWLPAAVALLTLTALTRQNGLAIVPFAAISLGLANWQRGASVRAAATYSAGLLAAVLILTGGANALLNVRSNGDSGSAEQLHLLALYDLSGAVAQEPALKMDGLADDDPGLEEAIRARGAKLYSPVRNDPVVSDPQIQTALAAPAADLDALMDQWRGLIVHHTGLYLRVRAMDFAQLFWTPDIIAARPVFTGIAGPAQALEQLGIAPRKDTRDRALETYGRALFGTPVWSHPAFAAAALGCLALLLWRRRPADLVMAALLLSAFAFTASFFVISISCDYRYLHFLDLSALAALFYLSLDTREAP